MTFLDPIYRDSQTSFLICFFHSSSLSGPLSNGLNMFFFGQDFADFVRAQERLTLFPRLIGAFS